MLKNSSPLKTSNIMVFQDDPYRTPLMETPRPRHLLSGNVPSRALPTHGLISPDERPGEEDNGSNMYLKVCVIYIEFFYLFMSVVDAISSCSRLW